MSKYHIKCTETDVPPKTKKKEPAEPEPPPEPPREVDTSLLASINPNLPCCCEMMSRAIRDDLPKILGMSSHRAALQIGQDDVLDCDPDIKLDNPCVSTTDDSKKPAKPPNGK